MAVQPFKYNLGLEAKDKITGFSGIIRYRVQYLTGCNQYGIQPTIKPDGTVPDTIQFDEHSLEIIGKGISETFWAEEEKEVSQGLPPRPPGGPQTPVASNPM